MMNLCIDIGNTKAKLAVFDNSVQRYFYVDFELTHDKIDTILSEYSIERAILSSTRTLEDDWLHQLREKVNLLIVDHSLPLPFTSKYETPETLGRDRIAGVMGAWSLFEGENCVVIDAGTCLTMDFIDSEGIYHGGNISPGIYLRRQSMHDFTDKLPLVDISFPSDFLGKSTEKALQNGILRGIKYEVESFIHRIEEEFGPTRVILTGGDTNFFDEHLNFAIFASPNLVLVGLNEILKLND